MLRQSNIDQYEKSQMLSARHIRDLGSGSQIPVRQKVRNACHGGTIWWNDQVVTGPLKNYIWKPR
jgi:hypothetical protein